MVRGKCHTPQEIEVHYILPALRSALTKELKAQGRSQKEIAQLLNVTEPAVSHYVNEKRATKVAFNDAIKELVARIAGVVETPHDVMAKTQEMLKVVRQEGIVCGVCRPITGAPHDCQICFQ